MGVVNEWNVKSPRCLSERHSKYFIRDEDGNNEEFRNDDNPTVLFDCLQMKDWGGALNHFQTMKNSTEIMKINVNE